MSLQSTKLDEATMKVRLDKFPAATPAGGWIAPLLEEVAAVQKGVAQGNWSGVLPQSARCLGFGYAALRWVEGEIITTHKRNEILRQTRRGFGELLKALARSDSAKAFFTKLRKQIRLHSLNELAETAIQELRKKVSERNIPDEVFNRLREQIKQNVPAVSPMDESLQMLAQGKTHGVPLLDALDRLGEVPSKRMIYEAAIACLSRGLLAWVHAEFNLAFQQSQSERDILAQKDTQDVFTNMVDEFAAQLRAGQLTLYSALASARLAPDVAPLAYALAGTIEARLAAFAHMQAKLDLTAKTLREQGKRSAAGTMGRLAVRAGTLTREALATHAASYRLAFELGSEVPHVDVVNLQKNAAPLPFDVKLPNGKNVDLGKLDALKEGTFVEIEGVVQAVKAGRSSDQKLISQIELLDPSSGTRAQAVALFVNLPHMGVTVDAYCRLNGIFRKRSKLLDDKPAIEVDRLSIDKLKAQSWWVAFLQLADPWFPYWRNNTNMYWSLGPHQGFENEDTGRQGAAEIIFLPIIRS